MRRQCAGQQTSRFHPRSPSSYPHSSRLTWLAASSLRSFFWSTKARPRFGMSASSRCSRSAATLTPLNLSCGAASSRLNCRSSLSRSSPGLDGSATAALVPGEEAATGGVRGGEAAVEGFRGGEAATDRAEAARGGGEAGVEGVWGGEAAVEGMRGGEACSSHHNRRHVSSGVFLRVFS
eukprot:2711965-Rhodomonas_salina.2